MKNSDSYIFLQGWRSCAITTLGRGGSDLTATTIGKALGLREIQVIDLVKPRLHKDGTLLTKHFFFFLLIWYRFGKMWMVF